MTPIPRTALILGLLGLLPFLWGAVTQVYSPAAEWGARNLGPRFIGPYVGLAYGTVILSFMSGVLWGFSTRAKGSEAAVGYALSVIPALWAFFFIGGGPVSAAIWLAGGFVLVLMMDYMFWRQGLAPDWWLRLRILLSLVVLACLSVTIFL